jgi:hypothetical protein
VIGPIFTFSAMRLARKPALFRARALYVLLLLGGLLTAYHATSMTGNAIVVQAELASTSYERFRTLQFLAVLSLAPALAAGMVTEEKENRTLPLVLGTRIGSVEFIFGKMLLGQRMRRTRDAVILAVVVPIVLLGITPAFQLAVSGPMQTLDWLPILFPPPVQHVVLLMAESLPEDSRYRAIVNAALINGLIWLMLLVTMRIAALRYPRLPGAEPDSPGPKRR